MKTVDLHYRLNSDATQICVEAYEYENENDKWPSDTMESWFPLASKSGEMYLQAAISDGRFPEIAEQVNA